MHYDNSDGSDGNGVVMMMTDDDAGSDGNVNDQAALQVVIKDNGILKSKDDHFS